LAISVGTYFFLVNKPSEEKPLQNEEVKTSDSAQDDFQNKMECYNLKEKIEIDMEKFNSEQTPEKRTVDRGAVEEYMCFEQKELKEIFFSKKLNTCLHVEIDKTICKSLMSYSSGEYYVSYETDYLIDTLSNEKIDFNNGLNFLQIINNGQQFNTQEDADKIINEYK
jgi:hypothetical protein